MARRSVSSPVAGTCTKLQQVITLLMSLLDTSRIMRVTKRQQLIDIYARCIADLSCDWYCYHNILFYASSVMTHECHMIGTGTDRMVT